MKKKSLALLLAAFLASGCMTGRMGPQPFSKRWANERLQEKEHQARLERIGKPLFKTSDGLEESSRKQPGELGASGKRHRGGIVLHQFKW